MQPFCELGGSNGAGAGLDGVLEILDGELVHDVVEEADAVVDVAAFLIFFGDPVEPFVDFAEVFPYGVDFLHFDNATVMSGLGRFAELLGPTTVAPPSLGQ